MNRLNKNRARFSAGEAVNRRRSTQNQKEIGPDGGSMSPESAKRFIYAHRLIRTCHLDSMLLSPNAKQTQENERFSVMTKRGANLRAPGPAVIMLTGGCA